MPKYSLVAVDHNPFEEAKKDLPKGETRLSQGPMSYGDWWPFVKEALKQYGGQVMQGMADSAMLPGNVLQGKVDPASEQGLGQVLGLAGMVSGGPIVAPTRGALNMGWGSPIKNAVTKGLEKPKAKAPAEQLLVPPEVFDKYKNHPAIESVFYNDVAHGFAQELIAALRHNPEKYGGKLENAFEHLLATIPDEADVPIAHQAFKDLAQWEADNQTSLAWKPKSKTLQPEDIKKHPAEANAPKEDTGDHTNELLTMLKSYPETYRGDVTNAFNKMKEFIDEDELPSAQAAHDHLKKWQDENGLFAFGKGEVKAPEAKPAPWVGENMKEHPAVLSAKDSYAEPDILMALLGLKQKHGVKDWYDAATVFGKKNPDFSVGEIFNAADHLKYYEDLHGEIKFADTATKKQDPWFAHAWEHPLVVEGEASGDMPFYTKGLLNIMQKYNLSLPEAKKKLVETFEGVAEKHGPIKSSIDDSFNYIKSYEDKHGAFDFQDANEYFKPVPKPSSKPTLASTAATKTWEKAPPAPPRPSKEDLFERNIKQVDWKDYVSPEGFTIPTRDLETQRRAEAMGFNTNFPLFKGMRDFVGEGFTDIFNKKGEAGNFFADNTHVPKYYTGENKGVYVPVFAAPQRPFEVNWPDIHDHNYYSGSTMADLIQYAKNKLQADALVIKNIGDLGGPQNQYVIMDQSILRNPWAEFNPSAPQSNDLLRTMGNPLQGAVMFNPEPER